MRHAGDQTAASSRFRDGSCADICLTGDGLVRERRAAMLRGGANCDTIDPAGAMPVARGASWTIG
jgi:hypothetical protein